MGTNSSILKNEQLSLALQRLELFLEPETQELLDELQPQNSAHLPQLSRQLRKKPFQIKKKLDELKAAGIVYSSTRYPKGYALNYYKCLKIKLQASNVVKSL